MKTFSIRTLLILMAACGFACWYCFVPVHVEVPAIPVDVGLNGKLPNSGQEIFVGRIVDIPPGFEFQRVTLISLNDDKSMVTVAMSRWDSWWCEGDVWYYQCKLESKL